MVIETYGAYGPQGPQRYKLVKQISKKIQDATGENLSTFYLFQSISMAVQKELFLIFNLKILPIYFC